MRMKRLVVALLSLALLAAPLPAEAQPTGKPVRLGLLYRGSPAFNREDRPCGFRSAVRIDYAECPEQGECLDLGRPGGLATEGPEVTPGLRAPAAECY
jgi:hypothetical protein